ncbi:MAG: hypothetical protein MK165_02105 [Pirellulaceae bacterium]|nr:hypothetical protein [Pirellulaceae bacterium]
MPCYLIGTDEAGYGPNLGPLVVSASVWKIPQETESDLYHLLEQVVTKKIESPESNWLGIADSKILFNPTRGIAAIERSVLATLQQVKGPVDKWSELWPLISPSATCHLLNSPWYQDYEEPLPIAANHHDILQISQTLGSILGKRNVELIDIQSCVISAHQFNVLLDKYENKASLLSACTLNLVKDLIDHSLEPNIPIMVTCDKHGGRNRYRSLLLEHFPEHLLDVVCEGRAQSCYRWGRGEHRMEFRFVAKGESFLPSALASMYSKYLRELTMRAFNHFWKKHVPGVKATAGYPSDAKRFHRDIAQSQKKLKIADAVLWRRR